VIRGTERPVRLLHETDTHAPKLGVEPRALLPLPRNSEKITAELPSEVQGIRAHAVQPSMQRSPWMT
jgi:hypothetical protein